MAGIRGQYAPRVQAVAAEAASEVTGLPPIFGLTAGSEQKQACAGNRTKHLANEVREALQTPRVIPVGLVGAMAARNRERTCCHGSAPEITSPRVTAQLICPPLRTNPIKCFAAADASPGRAWCAEWRLRAP
jgi:hypothetical protein